MHPVLFHISFIEARSYYVLWAFALLLFVFWTRRRCVKMFGMSWEDATSAVLWVYCAAILGAMAGSALEKLPLVISGAQSLALIKKGGLSSGPGLLCGGLAGIWRLRRLHLSLDDFSEACSIPAAMMLGIGRIGCFMDGCCKGIGFDCTLRPWWGVHFPTDAAGFFRYPSQISESTAAFCLALLLFVVERSARRSGVRIGGSAILFPLFLILYGAYRLIFDFFREAEADAAFNSAHWLAAAAIVLGIVWLWHTAAVRLKAGEKL